jgi:orotidine-5'-phosphate decarboxylase
VQKRFRHFPQDGDIKATAKAGKTEHGTGLMINSPRAILYAGKGENYAAAINRWR